MIISKIYNNLSKSKKEVFVEGLVWGLVGGLVWGLVGGLVEGLVWGLVWGLVGGLVVILVNFTEALPFINGLPSVLFLLGVIFILVELFFHLSPKEKVRKGDLFKHTLKRKAECLFEVLLILSAICQIYIFGREIGLQKILEWIGYIGAGLIGLILLGLIFYFWIKLNTLKYVKRGK